MDREIINSILLSPSAFNEKRLFSYCSAIDYNYDSARNCDDSCSGVGGICRCEEIISEQVTEVCPYGLTNTIVKKLVDSISKTRKINKESKQHIKKELSSVFFFYCLYRLLIAHNAHDPHRWDLIIGNGYYGQEILGVEFLNFSALKQDLSHLLSLDSDDERVRFVLEKEYGFLLPHLVDAEFDVEYVPREKLFSKKLDATDFYQKKPYDYVYYYDVNYDKKLPIGIYNPVADNYYVVDGHHRYEDLVLANPKIKQFPVISIKQR